MKRKDEGEKFYLYFEYKSVSNRLERKEELSKFFSNNDKKFQVSKFLGRILETNNLCINLRLFYNAFKELYT